MKRSLILTAVAVSVLGILAAPAGATVVVSSETTSGNTLPTTPASNTDLLQTNLTSVSPVPGGTNLLTHPHNRNGTTGTAGENSGANPATIHSTGTYDFSLDLTASATGYRIDEVDVYTGWGDFRAGQDFRAFYSVVGDASFVQFADVNTAHSNGTLRTSITDDSGPLATAVDQLRFIVDQSTHVYREIDVIGAASTLPPLPPPPAPAEISWTGGPTTVTSTTDIDLTGTLVHAGNWGSGSQTVVLPTETIVFADRPINIGDPFASATATGEYSHGSVYNGDTGNGAFNSVLDGFAYDGANPKVVTLLGGLTPGRDYQIQLFTSDDRGCCGGRTQKWSDNATSGAGNETAVFSHNASVSVIGQFTATLPTQDIFGHGVGQGQNIVNAYVLRDITVSVIPEPITMLAVGLGVAGLGGYVRRRRRC